jgi:hypothetical protein
MLTKHWLVSSAPAKHKLGSRDKQACGKGKSPARQEARVNGFYFGDDVAAHV